MVQSVTNVEVRRCAKTSRLRKYTAQLTEMQGSVKIKLNPNNRNNLKRKID